MRCPLKEREAKTRQFSRAFIHVAETKWYVLVSFFPAFHRRQQRNSFKRDSLERREELRSRYRKQNSLFREMICAILVVFFPLGREKGLISLFARGICASVSSLLNALSLAQRGIALSVGYFSTWTRRARGRNAFAYLSLVTFCNSTRIYWFSFAHRISLFLSLKKKNSRRKKRSKSRKSWAKSKSKTARSRNGFA